ncbi:transmembrane 220 family protein [Leeuwenhoekiella sp. A16]|uniref:transmembrane 220 family protein n=1 Tax=unclassified Leeuwenhoekiella TaxID=2615029 RepID=UPI003A8085E9
MKTLFKIFALGFAILFAWAAYLQNNDPDSFLWYLIYGSAALACISFIFHKLHFAIALVLAIVFLIGAIYNWPAQFEGVSIGSGEIENIERGRESLGLLINAVVMAILAWRINLQRKL